MTIIIFLSNKNKYIMANANSNDTTKQDIYENYIIRSNVQLQEENTNLKEELKELQSQCDELEEDISRKEQRTVNEKGLMHNLYDIKQSSVKITKYYKENMEEYYEYADSMNKAYSHVNPEMIAGIEFIQKFIHLIFMFPVFAFYMKYIDMFECLYIMGFQFIPFPIVCLYVKYFSKHIEIRNYSQIHESCIRNINKAKKIEDEMEETERGCCSLDNIIDDM